MKLLFCNIKSSIIANLFKIGFDKSIGTNFKWRCGMLGIIILFVVLYFFNLILILKILIFKLQVMVNTILGV